jgi:hypothetical protein
MKSAFTSNRVISTWITIAFAISLLTGCQPGEETIPVETIAFTPSSALVGDTITLTGTQFTADTAKNIVSFGSQKASVVAASTTELKVIVPDGSESGKISVKSEGSTGISASNFNVFNLYIGGFGENSNPSAAVYWKNGTPTILSGPQWAFGRDIAVSGKNVYLAGTIYFGFDYKALLWKDGLLKQLSNETEKVYLNSVFVSGNDVYAGGFAYYGTIPTAVYWKNDQLVKLGPDNGKDFSQLNAITVANNDVYAVGRQKYLQADGKDVATYWKNGQPFPLSLSEEGLNSEAKAITVVNNDVYIAGDEYVYNVEYQGSYATYWKNGQPVRLNDIKTERAISFDIKVVDNNVYVAGMLNKDNKFMAVYWKNGVLTKLTDSQSATAYGIEVFNNHVYVVGNEWIDGRLFPRLWIDGKQTDLTGKGILSGTAYSIVITQ